MADVRQLLRAERAHRRLTHPHASYTKDGKLLCNLCETPVKSEANWQSHLHSTPHLLRSQRAKETEHVRNTGAKKRKAESPGADSEVEDRKRVRPSEEQTASPDREDASRPTKRIAGIDNDTVNTPSHPEDVTPTAPQAEPDVDESELAAFERELATLEQESAEAEATRSVVNTALNAAGNISAAPMTAEELAREASEKQSAQRGKRDDELEAEKEDAARLLEEELEEMEGLEERVRRLREQREALRVGEDVREAGDGALKEPNEATVKGAAANNEHDAEGEDDDDDDDDDDGDDWDDSWGFGGR